MINDHNLLIKKEIIGHSSPDHGPEQTFGQGQMQPASNDGNKLESKKNYMETT